MGTWDTTLVELEVKDDLKPVFSQPYPVPKVLEGMFRKKVKIIISLGVLEEENYFKWGAPLFSQPKAKTNRVRFLSGFQNLNR